MLAIETWKVRSRQEKWFYSVITAAAATTTTLSNVNAASSQNITRSFYERESLEYLEFLDQVLKESLEYLWFLDQALKESWISNTFQSYSDEGKPEIETLENNTKLILFTSVQVPGWSWTPLHFCFLPVAGDN